MRREAAVVRAGLLLALALGGCATVAPRVNYRVQTAASADSAVPYQLTDTSLVIGIVPPPDAKSDNPVSLEPVSAQCGGDGCRVAGKLVRLAAVAVPVPFAGTVLTVSPRARRFVSTTLVPTYFRDTLRLRVLSVEAKDHRVEIINAAGTVVRALAGLAGLAREVGFASAGPTPPRSVDLLLPVVVDLAALKPAIVTGAPLRWGEDWQMTANFGDDPGALGFRKRASAGDIHGGIATSICRPLTLTLDGGNGAVLRFGMRVADPDWLETIPFPPKGTMILHPLCGADVTADPVARVGVDAIADAFAAQVQGVRAAAK